MGVLGLWQLLKPSGRPTKLQGLEGKKLAIDISIWLHQANKGVRGSANGHIQVLYNRICKLLYFKIKPIFVFDGPNVPKLKQRVLRERQRRRNAAAEKAKSIQDQIQKKILETHILKNVTGVELENSLPRTSKSTQNETSDIDDLFILKDNPGLHIEDQFEEEKKEAETDDGCYEHIDLEDMDPNVFESLPDDVKFDILLEQKQRLREKKTLNFNELPQNSDDFSSYQMSLLLKKSSVSNKINELKANIKSQYSAGTDYDDLYHQKVASEADSEVILFTKKFINKFTAKNILDEIHAKRIDDYVDEEETTSSVTEPTCRIQFNINNKIELVSNSENETNDQNDSFKLEEKYIQIENDNSIKNTHQNDLVQNKKDDEIIEEKFIQKVDQQQKNNLKISKKNDEKKDQNFQTDLPEEILSDIQKKLESRIVGHDSENNKTVQVIVDKNDHHILNKQLVETNDVADETDEEDEFIEVKNNEVELIKEMIDFSKAALESQSDSEEQKKNQSDLPVEILSEIQENLETEIDRDSEKIETLNSNLINETNRLIKEKELNDRLSGAVERHIIDDAKLLLQLFGLPFVQSPGEAEAQCAFLDYSNQTDGSITEDSDVWLFGARKVYKNFFGTDQFIDFYSDTVIKSQIGLDREALIDVALLVGSDYTEGVENVGIVKAVEILNEFEGDGLEKLKKFKEWHQNAKKSGLKLSNKIRQAFLKLNLSEGFPSEVVYNAYIYPDIDKSTEEFSWSMPDLDSIRKFLIKKMNWSVKKIDDDLLPIIRRLNETTIQKTIENFFVYERKSSLSKQSKRMRKAITLYKSKSDIGHQSKELNLSEDEEQSQSQNSSNYLKSDIIVIDDEDLSSNKRKSSESNSNTKAKKQIKHSNKRSNTKKK